MKFVDSFGIEVNLENELEVEFNWTLHLLHIIEQIREGG